MSLPLIALLLLAPAQASPHRVELSARPDFTLVDGAEANLQGPTLQLGLGVDVDLLGRPRHSSALLTGASLQVGGPSEENRAFSALVRVRYRLQREQLAGYAGLGAGWYQKELHGGDWVHQDFGPTARLELGGTWFPVERFGLGLHADGGGYLSDAHDRNSSYPAIVPLASIGAELVVRLQARSTL